MALFTRSEFAAKWDYKPGNLSNVIRRGKLKVNAKNQIDDSDPLNKLWIENRKIYLQKRAAKAPPTEPPSPESEPLPEPPPDLDDIEIPTDMSDLSDSELKQLDTVALNKLKLMVEIRQKESVIKLNEIKIQKQQGELIPAELMKPIILQFSKAMSFAFKNAADELIIEIGHKFRLPTKVVASLRTKLVSIINKAIEKAVKTARKSSTNIAETFAESRSAGEKRT